MSHRQFSIRTTSAAASILSAFTALVLLLSPGSATRIGAAQKKAVPQTAPEEQGKSFATPDEAASALHAAARNNDETQLMVILGPGAKDLMAWTDDESQRQAERRDFVQKYDQMHRLVREPDGTMCLYVGAENWPLPIPLIERNGTWFFDTALGKQEVLFRRIGKNELEAIQVSHELVDAEKEYYAANHHYAQKFMSAGNAHDGLYWTGANSPIGPMLAHAGYGDSPDPSRMPFHGYFYRILAGPNGTGSDGFAVLAFPAEYRSSGVMTFITDQNGVAYERDLGPMTDRLATKMNSSERGKTWKKSS